jgi:hypothetical protein
MTVKELSNLLFKVDDEAEVQIVTSLSDPVLSPIRVEEKKIYSTSDDSFKPDEIVVSIIVL